MREEGRREGGFQEALWTGCPFNEVWEAPLEVALMWLWPGEGAAGLGPLGPSFSGSHAGWWDISAGHLVTTKFTQTGQNEDKDNTAFYLGK